MFTCKQKKTISVSKIHNFMKKFFTWIVWKTVLFSQRWHRHNQFLSKFFKSFSLEFSPFWKIYDNLVTRLGDFIKFENHDIFGTNFKLDAVNLPVLLWLVSTFGKRFPFLSKNFTHIDRMNRTVKGFQMKWKMLFSAVNFADIL